MKTLNQISKFKRATIMITKSLFVMMMVLFTSMTFAQSSVVDIVVNSADHNTLEAAVIAAELADDLSGDGPFALFAPTDAAFAALPEGTVATLLEDPTGDLAQILLYHVAGEKVMSSELVNGQSVSTLNGDNITITYKKGNFYVDNAKIVVADIKADNGVVHVIDAVILPSPPAANVVDECSGDNMAKTKMIAAE